MGGFSRQGFAAVIDIGTTKVCCLIARNDASRGGHSGNAGVFGPARIVGIGLQPAEGVDRGTIVDMEAAEHSIRAAVAQAETMANERVERVIATISPSSPLSELVEVEVSLGGQEVTDRELRMIETMSRQHYDVPDRKAIHAIPTSYAVDGAAGIRNPRNMFGEMLGVTMHFVSVPTGPLRNLVTCIERCHLELAACVIAPLSSALSTLIEDEKELGTVCIDLGGGTTTLGVFSGGALVYCDIVRAGGHHITRDIAQGLSTSIQQAERLKTLYGSALSSESDEQELIDVAPLGEDTAAGYQVTRAQLTAIVQARVYDTLERVRDKLHRSGFESHVARSVVLTGGASQLNGIAEAASAVLGRQVRVGRPMRIAGLADTMAGPAFAASAGLVAYAVGSGRDTILRASEERARRPQSRVGWFGQWLRENL